jgi:hypothetical protein
VRGFYVFRFYSSENLRKENRKKETDGSYGYLLITRMVQIAPGTGIHSNPGTFFGTADAFSVAAGSAPAACVFIIAVE